MLMRRVFVKTFGCQMNEADSQEMLQALFARGFARTEKLSQADMVLLNTCTVREHAEHRAVSYIGRLKSWKKLRPGRIVIVAGCAAQRMQDTLKKNYPHVDIVAGAKSIERFPEILDERISGLSIGPVPARKSPLLAYVTVMRGCGCNCAYCIVPQVRGEVKSRPAADVLGEIADKVKNGAREVMLLGQTVNAYRDGATTFPVLLEKACAVKGLARLRFMSPHPIFITPELVRVMAENKVMAKHLHLPAQSGSDRVLALMKRGYTRAQYLEKISALRHAMPDIAISTDFIVGFPTETENDFEDTLSLAAECGVSFAYCFKYSPRSNTAAAAMGDNVPEDVKEKRLERLLEVVRKTAADETEKLRGTVQEILLESPNRGRTSSNFWAETDRTGEAGTLVRAEIDTVGGKLKARIVL